MLRAKHLAASLHGLPAQLLRLGVVALRQHCDGKILLRLQRFRVPGTENTLPSFPGSPEQRLGL